MASETNAAIQNAKSIRQDAKFREEFIPHLVHDINADAQAIDQHWAAKRKAYDRRYQQGSKRPVNFPWPNASSFDYPGSDIEIDEAKPSIIAMHLGGSRIWDMVATTPESAPQATAAGIAMDYLCKFRMGQRGVPDYYKQTALSVESFLQNGYSLDKVVYSYMTERRREVYTRETLPDALKMIQVVDKVSPDEQQQFMQEAGVMVIQRDQFGEFAEQIEGVVVDIMNLDLQNREDRIALNETMAFIKRNNPNASLEIVATQVVEDAPRVINCEPESVLLPSGVSTVQSASRVTHDMWFTEHDLQMRKFNGMWKPEVVDMVLENASNNRRAGQIDQNRMHDGMRLRSETMYEVDRDDAHFKISEAYCYKRDASGVPIPVVITMERQMGAVLRAKEYDYAHGAWPITESCYEINDHSFISSRGIPEKIRGLEEHMSALIRAELNGMVMGTSQSFTYRQNSGINPQKLRWMPHLMIPVRNHDDLQPIQTNTSALMLERPMLLFQSLISKVTGGRLNTTTNEQRQDRPPTATQVNEQSLSSQSSHGMRGQFFQIGRQEIGRQIWALWRQFGPDKFYAQVANEPLKELTQHEIRGDFTIIPRGAVGDMDPQFRLQQSMQALDMLVKIQPLIQQDPRYVPDIAQAVKEVFDRMDPTMSMRLLRQRTPEEIQQFIEQQQAEAERMAALKDEAQRLQQGAAVTPEGQLELQKTIRQESPHKGLQPIVEGATQAQKALEQSQALAQTGDV